MVSGLIELLERLGWTPINRWAYAIHVAALTALAVFWLMPVVTRIIRELTRREKGLWVRFWVCPACGQLNRRTFAKCQRCERALPSRWRDRWEASALAERLRNWAHRYAALMRGLGWLFTYGIPAVAVYAFRLYSFNQNPLRELLGAVALCLLLLVLFFFRSALRTGWRAPVDSLIYALAGVALTGFFAASSFLWAAAPYPREKPLAMLEVLSTGQIRLADAMGRETIVMGAAGPKQVSFRVRFTTFSWPLFSAHQTLVTHVEGKPVTESWTISLLEGGAAILAKDSRFSPRVIILEQTFSATAGRTYDLYVPASTLGLAIQERPSKPSK